MLPKKHRLVSRNEILKARSGAHRNQSKLVRISLKKHHDTEFKLLVIVSKKIFKKAVNRNRTRRKIHSVFETLLQQDRLPPRISCLIQVYNKEILRYTSVEIQNDIIPILKNLYNNLKL